MKYLLELDNFIASYSSKNVSKIIFDTKLLNKLPQRNRRDFFQDVYTLAIKYQFLTNY